MTPEQALIRIYQQAAKRLRLQIRIALENEAIGTAAYRQRQLERVQLELRALGQRTRRLAVDVATQPYLRGAAAVDVVGAAEGRAAFAFAGAHRRAASTLAQNLAVRLGEAQTIVGRRTDDAFRRAALEVVARATAAGETRLEASAALEDRLIREGVTDSLTGFVDRRGARWQLDTYSEMVTRTTTREASTAGTVNRLLEVGQSLITISDHSTSTELCQAYEGQTFSLPGITVEGYDEIDQLPPFHPNCLHHATPADTAAEDFVAMLEGTPTDELDAVLAGAL